MKQYQNRKNLYTFYTIRSNTKGVTLTEIMFSFLILAVATLAASGLLSYGHRSTSKDFRMVVATQILTDRMNRLLKIPFASHSAEINPPDTVKIYGPNTSGLLHNEIPYGPASFPLAGDYQVEIRLEHLPVHFEIQPFLVTNNYDPASAATYNFSPTIDTSLGNFASSDRSSREFYKVIRLTVHIYWNEPNGIRKDIYAVSFKTNLEGA